jgi:hypothetical protein
MLNVYYNTVLYRFIAANHLDGSIISAVASGDIPEGSIISLNSSGQAVQCNATTIPLGVARHAAKSGTTVSIEQSCIIENRGVSLGLTPGTRVFAAAAGAVAATGTNAVSVALTANRVAIALS